MNRTDWRTFAAMFGGFLPMMALIGFLQNLELSLFQFTYYHGNALFLSGQIPALYLIAIRSRRSQTLRSSFFDGLFMGYSGSILIRLMIGAASEHPVIFAFGPWSYQLPTLAAVVWMVVNAILVVAVWIVSITMMIKILRKTLGT